MIPFDSGMLLVANDERLLLYNESAARIWSGLEAGADPEEMAEILSRTNGADAEAVRRDIASLIAEWRSEKVLPGAVSAPSPKERKPLPPRSRSPERWVCGIRGRKIGFAVDDAGSARMVRLLLDPLVTGSTDAEAWIEVRDCGGGESAVLTDGIERARVRNGIGLRDTVHAALFDLAWPDRPISALIHGGAVAREGKGLCFAGSAGSGKTTLIAHLAKTGWDYLGDDMAPVDGGGELLPWPTPLSVKAGSWPALEALHPGLEWGRPFEAAKGPARLLMPADGAWDSEPVPIRAFVFPRFDREAEAALVAVAPIEALSRLFEAGLWLGHPLTEERVRAFLAWFGKIPAYALTYSCLEEAETLAAGLFDARPPETARS